jgi:hypothetical protein
MKNALVCLPLALVLLSAPALTAQANPAPARTAADKSGNLVFLNIAKLDALKPQPGERRTEFWDRASGGSAFASARRASRSSRCVSGFMASSAVPISASIATSRA